MPSIMGVMGRALTAAELGYLVKLLQRFAENDLGQHGAWRLNTSDGPVYVRLSRKRTPDEPADAFRPVEPPSPYHTSGGGGRALPVAHGGREPGGRRSLGS